MELDEMKSLWADVSLRMENQDKIQKELLIEITKQKFRSKLDYVRVPEIIGSFVCVGYAMYLLSHFSELELWYNQVFALISVLIMIILPVASLTAIKSMRSLRLDKDTPTVLLQKFAKSKVRFFKTQRYGIIFGAILMFTILPPYAELSGSDSVTDPLFWMIFIPTGPVVMYLLSRWVLKKYKGVIESSEKMLEELE
ncbi:hypothetical protein SAMN04489724_0520 [Algoriphagus locisalis]|uniref:DUF3278 domain-containing protein n=1 Tax=Algoriphagus locisalis TaxID=305507 RepID=A0A1I6XJE2_9BACT|nr:hypothetical protein [Algoriphagus locisalis]SFT38430.1 hypothetical protein SAMN04489724_0520 [Algoriphagus locisalis]